MSRKKTLIIIILIFIILVTAFVAFYANYTISKRKDALEFKESYESLNGTKRESDGEIYNTISIPEDNPIKSINVKQVTKLLKDGTGVIYFGANWCPWCRTILPVLFESASINNVNTIYYLDIDNLNSGFEIQNNELIRKEENISEGYTDLIKSLDKVLGSKNNELKDSNGNSYDTGEKSIHVPLVITVKQGIITSYHNGAISLDSDQSKYDSLTEEQHQNLLDLYNKMFETLK